MAAVDSEEPQEAVAELAAQEARAAHTAEEAQAKVVEWEEVKGMEEQVEEGLVEGGLVEEEMVEAEGVEMEGEVSREAEVETQADHEGATEVEWALVGEEGAGLAEEYTVVVGKEGEAPEVEVMEAVALVMGVLAVD